MICPHCLVAFKTDDIYRNLGRDNIGEWSLQKTMCPECRKYTFILTLRTEYVSPDGGIFPEEYTYMVWPKGSNRPPCPEVVDEVYAEDYKEACLVLPDSPKASAALSRRCLQNIIHNHFKIKKANLKQEIDELLSSGQLRSDIEVLLHQVREIGNLAAHPMSHAVTGQVVPVEPWEAEWLLEILEALFDFCFVQPAKNKERMEKVQKKMDEAKAKP